MPISLIGHFALKVVAHNITLARDLGSGNVARNKELREPRINAAPSTLKLFSLLAASHCLNNPQQDHRAKNGGQEGEDHTRTGGVNAN